MTSLFDWRFLHPWMLLLLPLPLAWLAWTWLKGREAQPSVLYSGLGPLARAARATWRTRAVASLPLLRTLVLLLGILALARPQHGQVERLRSSMGIDIALVMDVSLSMQQDDFRPNRLEVAKKVMREFIAGRETDRFSLIVFATTAAVLTPPTFDRAALNDFIDIINQGIITDDSTAIGMGMALAVDRLKDSDARSRVVILLSDGENNAGNITPRPAAEIAKTLGVRAYTIGVGTLDVGWLASRRGATPLDETDLREIADITGGKYFRATSEEALRDIYAAIDQLERTEIEVTEYADYEERFMWFWGPALLLLGLELLVRGLVLVRLP